MYLNSLLKFLKFKAMLNLTWLVQDINRLFCQTINFNQSGLDKQKNTKRKFIECVSAQVSLTDEMCLASTNN